MTPPRTGSLDVAGARLAYDDAGQGLPVLLLHGFPHDRSLWTTQRDALATRARIIVPDLRGFGASTAAPPYAMDRYADDVVALLDALHVDRVVLGGLSMGGYVALAVLRRHPERLRALILANTRATADDAAAREHREALIATARRDGAESVAAAQLTGLLGATTRRTRPDVVGRTRAMLHGAATSTEGIVGALEAMRDRPDSTPLLAGVAVPTLVIAGDEDALTPAKEMRHMATAIPGSTFELVPEAGHLTPLERPELVTATLARFLDRLD